MTPTEYRDRLQRLDRRSDTLFKDLKNNPQKYLHMMQLAWKEARSEAPSENLAFLSPSRESDAAAGAAAMLDAILCLLERIARPSSWLDDQATWFNRARHCLLDAVDHAARVYEEQRLLPPLLITEPIDSPLYYPRARGTASWVRPATPADLPLPVIVCPGNILEEPWEWASLFHELGHHLDKSRKETEQLTAELLKQEEELQLDLGSWPDWIQESIADIYAGLLGGPNAVEALIAAFARNPYGSAGHPPGEARAEVLVTTWKSLREGTSISATQPTFAVAKILAEHFRPWHSHLQKDHEQPVGDSGPPRLVPGKLWRSYQRGAEPTALRELCLAMFAKVAAPDWALPEARLATLKAAMRHLVETRVTAGTEPKKLPPVELLVRHDSISFVGATHGQLLPQLKEAMRQRCGKAWQRIEIFALADLLLSRLTLDQKSGAALIEERDLSLRNIKDFLLENNILQRQFIYDAPCLMASYWDAEDNEARLRDAAPAHIHVSSPLWGMDLRRVPGQDYEAPAGHPLPSPMRQYVEALQRLRQSSTEL